MVCHDFTTNTSSNQERYSGRPGDAGSSGTPGVPPASAGNNPDRAHPPLPGFEEDFPPLPLELDNSSETLTEIIDKVLANPSCRDLSTLDPWQREYLLQWEEANGLGVGACLNIFPSGEITGGCYSLGRKSAPGRRGKVVSQQFTRQARKTIRRAVENSKVKFCRFMTMTFDPKKAKLDESGRVDQKWAKDELIRYLNTIKKKYDRMADKTGNNHWRISYMWVAEVQQNGNIHFHCLLNRHLEIKWLVKIWGQAPNSVNIKTLKDYTHAVMYMLKYMGKDNSPIEGRRYGMSQDLIEASKPLKLDFYGRARRKAFLNIKEELGYEMTQNGGKIFDWGFSLPPPRREQKLRDKQGFTRTLRGTSRGIGMKLRQKIEDAMTSIDTMGEILARDDNTLDDLPF